MKKDQKDRTTEDCRCESMMTAVRRRWLGGTGRHDAGLSLLETTVATVIFGVLAMSAVGLLRLSVHNGGQGVNRTEVHGTQLDASSLLARDVKEGTVLHAAEDHTLEVDVVRDATCWNRTYELADSALTVTTIYYEQAACRGPSVTKVETLVQNIVAADSKFTYYTDTDIVLAPPIDDLRSVKRIGWALSSDADGWENPLNYTGASVFTGLGDTTGTGEETLQATRAVLTVTTGTAEGKSAPVLTWVNPNPADYVSQWVLFRAANPEGSATTDADRGNWQQVGPTFPAATLTWTDTTLPAGYTASYVIRPNLSDGSRGPESNAVVTGLRPAQVTGLTATGQPTSVKLAWNTAVGATSFDIYRDGILFAHTTALTYTDKSGESGWSGSGYGHSHSYQVVPVNRWEKLTTTGAQDGVVALGAAVAQVYPRIGSTRIPSTVAGAFTAPAAPTVTVTPNSDWTFTLAWSPAAWVGSGPVSLTSHRDRGWVADVNSSATAAASGSWSGLWSGAENPRTTTSRVQTYTQAQIAGQYRHFKVSTCNEIGCSPDSATVTGLQRPPTPASCVASGATTRSMTVTVNPTASNSLYTGFRVTGGVGAADGTGTQANAVFSIDRLTHSSGQAFTGYSRNGSPAGGGLSDPVTCSGTTAVLGVAITSTSSTTRTVFAAMSTTNGNSSSLTLENVATQTNVGSASFDPLSDGTAFVVTARNSDGYNSVAAQQGVSTQVLTSPGAPACSISGGGEAPNGTATLTASGGTNVSSYGYTPQKARTGLASGTYTGSCRSIRTDGYNSSYSGWVSGGSVTVAQPWKVYNPPSGGASPTCNVLIPNGDVMTSLDAAVSAAGGKTVDGMNIGAPTSGSHRADYGTYISGSNGNNLSCVMWREHAVFDALGNQVGTWWANTRYTQGSGGAV